MVSLRKRVFAYIDSDSPTLKQCYKKFPEDNKSSVKHYYWEATHNDGYIPSITITNLDTIKEMTLTIQQIKDPDKRATQISRLHAMLLRPIANKDQKSLQEIFDAV